MKKKYIKVLERAIEKYGIIPQIAMIKEEAVELALAIIKSDRKGLELGDESVIDEVADVSIMIKQAELIYGKKIIDERIKFKVERLQRRLDGKEDPDIKGLIQSGEVKTFEFQFDIQEGVRGKGVHALLPDKVRVETLKEFGIKRRLSDDGRKEIQIWVMKGTEGYIYPNGDSVKQSVTIETPNVEGADRFCILLDPSYFKIID